MQAALTLPDGGLTAFVRMPSGTFVTAGMIGLDAVAWRSTDGGATFVPLPSPPHIRALAARNDALYASADNFVDDFAIGVSHDEGMSWQRLMSYSDVRAIKSCVRGACRDNCQMLADMSLWAPEICDAILPPGNSDGGDGGGTDARATPPDAPANDAVQRPTSKAGCSWRRRPEPPRALEFRDCLALEEGGGADADRCPPAGIRDNPS